MPRLTMNALIDKAITKLNASPPANAVITAALMPDCTDQHVRELVALVLGAGLDVLDYAVEPATGEIVDRTGQVRPRDDRNFRHLGGGRGGAKRVR